jgi:class 3 adenylate cyclase
MVGAGELAHLIAPMHPDAAPEIEHDDASATTPAPTAAARVRRAALRVLLYGLCAAGWLTPVVALARSGFHPGWSLADLLLGLGLVVVALYSNARLGMEFRFGGRDVEVTPDTVAWVAAAVFLPTPLAMLLGAVTLFTDVGEAPLRTRATDTGVLMASIGVSGAVVQSLLPHAGPMSAILLAALAAVAFTVAASIGGLAYVAVEHPDYVRDVADDMRVVSGFDIGLATLASALVAPFAHAPLRAIAAIVGYQFLTHATLTMLKSEQEHKAKSTYLKDTFSRYLPSTVVDQLGDDQAAIELGGEQHDITVMFVDVRNFTSWSESREPAEIVGRHNELMTLLTQAVFDTEGTLDKFTGDGLMAFWGAPVAQPDHADRAAAAALDRLQRVEQFNLDRPEGEIELRIGVGIHSGPAIVGNVGHVERLDYTAIGDTVNVSARLEAQTKE